jgi:hypothetical protein
MPTPAETSLSMLPTPPAPPPDTLAARLRAEIDHRRRVERDNLQLRQQLLRLQHCLQRRSTKQS